MKEECPHPVPLMHAVSAPSTLTATVIVCVCVVCDWCSLHVEVRGQFS